MRTWYLSMAVLGIALLASEPAIALTVPAVGCPSDGQMGPAAAPHLAPHAINLPAELANQLAYYQGEDTPGTLAPKGWHCFVLRGSSGTTTIVAPQPLSFAALDYRKPLLGPAIEVGYIMGGTSGRFEVAHLIARLFPTHKSFVRKVIAEGIEPAKDFPATPFPKDSLRQINAEKIEYATPANTEGLGTWGRLGKDNAPIRGSVTLLNNDDMDAIYVAMRLSPGQDRLTAAILSQAD